MNKQHVILEDTLSELSTICAERALSSLTQLAQTPDIHCTTSFLYGAQDTLWKQHATENEQVIGVLVLFSQDIHGMLLFIFHQQFVEELLWKTMQRTINFSELKEDELTVIEETASIVSSIYLETLSSYIQAKIKLHMPSCAYDMRGAIINDALGFMMQEEQLLHMEHHFFVGDCKEENQILFLLDEESTAHVIQTLEVI